MPAFPCLLHLDSRAIVQRSVVIRFRVPTPRAYLRILGTLESWLRRALARTVVGMVNLPVPAHTRRCRIDFRVQGGHQSNLSISTASTSSRHRPTSPSSENRPVLRRFNRIRPCRNAAWRCCVQARTGAHMGQPVGSHADARSRRGPFRFQSAGLFAGPLRR